MIFPDPLPCPCCGQKRPSFLGIPITISDALPEGVFAVIYTKAWERAILMDEVPPKGSLVVLVAERKENAP